MAPQYVDIIQSKLQLTADRQAVEQQKNNLRAQYQKTLPSLVESWNRACAAGDEEAMAGIRREVVASAPDSSLGAESLSLLTCVKKGCLQMTSQLALARLRVRVNPDIPPAAQDMVRRSPVTVRVRARIDEQGNVTVVDVQSSAPILNDPVRTAIERWKFFPIMDQSGTRCVETEIPVVIRP
jgi:TonB family protein